MPKQIGRIFDKSSIDQAIYNLTDTIENSQNGSILLPKIENYLMILNRLSLFETVFDDDDNRSEYIRLKLNNLNKDFQNKYEQFQGKLVKLIFFFGL